MFADLGLKYVGPIEAHDMPAVERALQQAKQFGGPVLVHCITRKGNGFHAAENHEEDRFHAVGKINAKTGEAVGAASGQTWTDLFSEELLRLGSTDERVVAITAAMMYPTGLHRFAKAFPDRCFDVGIAEQHAVTSAAGLALGGLHPVVAVYSTFLNRAFDQVLMDVALHECGVTFVLDRPVSPDPMGPATTACGTCRSCRWCLASIWRAEGRHPVTRRAGAILDHRRPADRDQVPQGSGAGGPSSCRPGERDGRASGTEQPRVLVVGTGQLAGTAVAVGERLSDQGIGVTVLDPVWVLPVNPGLLALAADHDLVITIEDNSVVGGYGARVAQELSSPGVNTAVRGSNSAEFIPHGSRAELLEEVGLHRRTSPVTRSRRSWAPTRPRATHSADLSESS